MTHQQVGVQVNFTGQNDYGATHLSHSLSKDSSPLNLIERTIPPGGGFLFTMFPNQEPGGRGPFSKNLYQVLRGGSSFSGVLMREHRKEGGVRKCL